jgi:hypothetical protein
MWEKYINMTYVISVMTYVMTGLASPKSHFRRKSDPLSPKTVMTYAEGNRIDGYGKLSESDPHPRKSSQLE